MAHNGHPERLLKMIERMQIGSLFYFAKIPTKSPQIHDIVVHDTDNQTRAEQRKNRMIITVLHDTDIIPTNGIND